MLTLDDRLIKAAISRIKIGFVPSGGDPSGGGGAPPDPGAGGGAPPPMDPSAAQPPMDPGPAAPDAGGGAPPPPGPDITSQVAQGVSQALAGSGLQGNKGQTAPKPDINTIATDVFQLKKMFFHVCRINGWELPPDILDGPNRDPMTGAPAQGQSGGSDAAPGSSMQQSPSSIKPITPIQGAFPSGGGGGGSGGGGMGKMSSDGSIGRAVTSDRIISKAAAVAMILRRQRLAC
jgi:hypothetical protein